MVKRGGEGNAGTLRRFLLLLRASQGEQRTQGTGGRPELSPSPASTAQQSHERCGSGPAAPGCCPRAHRRALGSGCG